MSINKQTRPECKWCHAPATNLVAFEFGDAGAVATITCCDQPNCLLLAREQASGDEQASITRLRNQAMLFHREAPKLPDHLPPFVCASCKSGRHGACDNKVVVRQGGANTVVPCDCATVQRHQPPGLGGRY